ncbi:hypothetical protein IFVP136_C230089 [Vibrio parahaemolyticus]
MPILLTLSAEQMLGAFFDSVMIAYPTIKKATM